MGLAGYLRTSVLVSGCIYIIVPLGVLSAITHTEGLSAQSESFSTGPTPTEPITTDGLEGYTFLKPGRSYLEYRPQWTSLEQWGLEFSFRTHKGTAVLLHNSFQGVSTQGASTNLWVRLKKGILHVAFIFNAETVTLQLGKGLAHDHWHNVRLAIDLQNGELEVSVDSEAHHNTTITPETLVNIRHVLVGNSLIGITSIGGFSPSQLQPPSRFIGCIRGVRFFEADQELIIPVHAKDGVEDGCLNACNVNNGCMHFGLCINYYIHTACDCFGTGYEGKRCDRPGGTVVTLQGSEWISYVISDITDRTHSPINKVGLEFKTRSTEGVLFYGYSQSQYNHLALSLHNSSLHVSVVFIDQDNYDELWVALGARLNDNKWHRIVVSHHGHEVEVELDTKTQKMTGRDNQRHLRMDPAVFIGGLENAHKALGLRSQQKFVGCLRAVYFNHDSVLEKLRTHRAVYHGGIIQYGCQDMEHTALQFPHQGAFVKAEHLASEQLIVQLEFRTLKPDSILLYTEIRSGADKGYIQVLLERGQVELIVVPSTPHPQVQETASVGENLHDNQWHSLQLDYNRGAGRLEVDGEVTVTSVRWDIHISKATYIGFGPDTQMKYGYVGCMRNVGLQGRDVDPVEVVHTQLGVGVTLGPCGLTDWCATNGSNCHNNGRCVSMWTDTYCECHGTHYEGKFCQFSKLRRSCAEYFHAGERRTGVWPVDTDGSGPQPPTHVYCEMGAWWEGRREGVTSVTHNLAEGTMVRDSSLADHKKVVTYRELTRSMLRALVAASESCHQWLHVNCSHSPLRLGELTWLVSSTGEDYSSFGGDTAGACGCGENHTCVNPKLTCNCDADFGIARWDGGYIRQSQHLPVMELIFRQQQQEQRHRQGQANVTMGPLRCGGTPMQSADTVVTFTRGDAYIVLPGWQTGMIAMSFRTVQRTAVLLYQPGPQAIWSAAQLYVMLKEGRYIEIQTEHPKLWKTVHASKSLDDGKWHHISMETSKSQVRIQVDGTSYLYPVDTEDGPGKSAQLLYVAGYPNFTGAPAEGLTGCVRGLTFNSNTHILQHIIPKHDSGRIVVGCDPRCDSSPCYNGATCQERWTSYTCRCANPHAHSGTNCEININKDSVTFLERSAFLEFHQPGTLDFAMDKVVFNFRTFQEQGLLLYVYDNVNNFLQLGIKGPGTLSVCYNNGRKITTHDISITELTNGQWKQVAIQLTAWKAEVFVNNYKFLLTHPSLWTPLKTYLQVPFEDEETVVPLRTVTGGKDIFHVYVGGVSSTMSTLDGSTGCMRGLKIGKHVIQLSVAAQTGSVAGVQPLCRPGCASSPCRHGGRCVEQTAYDGHFTCDCLGTTYAGALCEKETGLYFDGSSVLTQRLTPSSIPNTGIKESLSFNFATSMSSERTRALVHVTGENRLSDYILVYLTPSGVLGAEFVIDYYKVSLETSVSFFNGWPHHVSLHRDDTEITLKVDSLVEQARLNGSALLSPPTLLVTGGIIDEFRFSHIANFTGDISNVYFVSDQLRAVSVRPIDVYYGEVNTSDILTAVGTLRPASQLLALSSDRDVQDRVLLAGLPGTISPEVWTFPPWNVGPARTVNLAEAPTLKMTNTKDFVGATVCIAALLVFASAFILLVLRARRQKSTQKSDRQDEEEGLIKMVTTTTEDDGRRGSRDGSGALDDIRGLRARGTRKVRTPPSREELNEEENEETPMLSNMEETATSRPAGNNVDMTNFVQMIETLRLIDDEDEEDSLTERSTILQLKKDQDLSQESGDSNQLEWDPQVELTLSKPLMKSDSLNSLTDIGSTNSSLFKDNSTCSHGSSHHTSSSEALWWDMDAGTNDLVHCIDPLSASPRCTRLDGLVQLPYTEDLDMMWDSKDDLFKDALDDVDLSSSSARIGQTGAIDFSSLGQLSLSSDGTFRTAASPTQLAWVKPDSQSSLHLGPNSGQCSPTPNQPQLDLSASGNALAESDRHCESVHLAPTIPAPTGSEHFPELISARPRDIPNLVARNQSGARPGYKDPPGDGSERKDTSPGAESTTSSCSTASSSQATVLEMTPDKDSGFADLPSPPQLCATRAPHIEPNVIILEGSDREDNSSVETEDQVREALNIELSLESPVEVPLQSEPPTVYQAPVSDMFLVTPKRSTTLPLESAQSPHSNDGSLLSPVPCLLPEGTRPLTVPRGVSPGLCDSRSQKLKRSKRRSK